MAAAEYYNPRPSVSAQGSFLTPPQHPPRSSSQSGGYVYPPPNSAPNSSPHHQAQYPPPPPYQQPLDMHKPSVHFAPSTPPPPPQRNSFSHPQRPSPQSWNTPSYNVSPPQPPTSHPSYFPYNPQQYPYQPSPYPVQQMRPYINHNQSELSLGSGYNSDPEQRRRRRKSKEGRERGLSTGSRPTAADGLLGAAGGGLIGDLIFPGLGTVGGALAGWIGGKDYGKHRKWREDKRDREQREWERRHGARDRDYDDKRSRSHERRRSHE